MTDLIAKVTKYDSEFLNQISYKSACSTKQTYL